MSLPTEAKARKDVPIATGVVDYFPLALASIAELSRLGNEQHNPGTPLHWDRSKSGDEGDALMRHFVERGTFDTDGVRHSTKVAWRALALLQKEIEASNLKVFQECAPKVEAPRVGYIRYIGNDTQQGWWWLERGAGMTPTLEHAALYAEDDGARSEYDKTRTEFVPENQAKSRWLVRLATGVEYESCLEYTADSDNFRRFLNDVGATIIRRI